MTTASQPSRDQLLRRFADRRFVERRQNLAVGIHALGHFQPDLAVDQRIEGAAQAIGLRPRAAAELQHVAEALGGYQPDLGDLALQQRVGGRGRAVHQGLQRWRDRASAAASAAMKPTAWLSTVVGTLASFTVLDAGRPPEGR